MRPLGFATLMLGICAPTVSWAEAAESIASPAPEVEKLPPPPASLGALTPERLRALRTYKGQRIQVRAETEYRGGGSSYTGMAAGYPGAEVDFAGEFASTKRSYTSLGYAFSIAILAIYMILALQFQSYLQPFIILSAVAFALIGVVFGKMLTQGLFTVNSMIAIVGVTGVVVNDSLVLIDFINRSYRESGNRRAAIMEGIRIRLRPILLTTLTTTLGLLPMAIGFPYHSLVWGSMASTFVTGLCTATFLTLFIVPLEWDLLMAVQERWFRKRDNFQGSE